MIARLRRDDTTMIRLIKKGHIDRALNGWGREPCIPPILHMNRCQKSPLFALITGSLSNHAFIYVIFFSCIILQMTTYPSHFSQSLGNHGATMAYLKASPTYHMNGLSALGMSHGLDSLQSQSLHYNGGELDWKPSCKNNIFCSLSQQFKSRRIRL